MKSTLLAAALVVAFFGVVSIDRPMSGRARQIGAAAQIEAFEEALKTYAHDNGDYPSTVQGLEALCTKPPGASKWSGPYLPKDIPLDPWDHPFQYQYPGQHSPRPDIVSLGADGRPGGEGINSDIVSWKN